MSTNRVKKLRARLECRSDTSGRERVRIMRSIAEEGSIIMRNHKTGCGRCRRNVCCCPPSPVVTSGGGLLKFSGTISTETSGEPPTVATSYLADGGFFDPVALLTPIEYVMPVARTFENFAVEVTAALPGPFAAPVTFDFLVNGVPVFTVITTAPGIAPTAIGVVAVTAGSTISVRANTTAANAGAIIGATAMVGVS